MYEENQTATLLRYYGSSSIVRVPQYVSGIENKLIEKVYSPSYYATNIYYSEGLDESTPLRIYVSQDGINYEYIDEVSSEWEMQDYFWGQGLMNYNYCKVTYYLNTAVISDSGYLVIKLEETFYDNNTVEKIILPDTIEEIGKYTFFYSTATEINMPRNLEVIGEFAFDESHVKSIKLYDNLKVVGNYAFSRTMVDTIELPESVTTVGNGVFYESKVKKVRLPSTLMVINDSLFENCLELRDIVLPEGITEIKYRAFRCCRSLLSLIIPEHVAIIGSDVFYYNDRLVEICNLSGLNLECGSTNYGYLAFNALDIYTTKEYESKIRTFEESNLIYYDLGDNKYSAIGWINRDDTELNFIENCVEIGRYAFSYNSKVRQMIIPDTITKINYASFSCCSYLERIVLPDTVTSLPEYAFSFNDRLTSIEINYLGLEYIGPRAFINCSHLNFGDIEFGDSLTSIGIYAFDSCYLLGTVRISNNTTIGNNAFIYCSNVSIVRY